MSTAKSMLQESSSNSANIYLVLQIKNASLSVTFYVMEILNTVASSAAGCIKMVIHYFTYNDNCKYSWSDQVISFLPCLRQQLKKPDCY